MPADGAPDASRTIRPSQASACGPFWRELGRGCSRHLLSGVRAAAGNLLCGREPVIWKMEFRRTVTRGRCMKRWLGAILLWILAIPAALALDAKLPFRAFILDNW